MPVANSIHCIHHSNHIYNYFKSLKLGLFLSDVYLNHLMTIMVSIFLRGYRGKTIDFAEVSCQHRTTTAYFLNHGKWNDSELQDVLKRSVIQTIYREALLSGEPIFCIVDDTIASHTKPSSQPLHPIEAAYFHQSHLKGCQDYVHQVVSVMLSSNGIILNYAVILYDRSKSIKNPNCTEVCGRTSCGTCDLLLSEYSCAGGAASPVWRGSSAIIRFYLASYSTVLLPATLCYIFRDRNSDYSGAL